MEISFLRLRRLSLLMLPLSILFNSSHFLRSLFFALPF